MAFILIHKIKETFQCCWHTLTSRQTNLLHICMCMYNKEIQSWLHVKISNYIHIKGLLVSPPKVNLSKEKHLQWPAVEEGGKKRSCHSQDKTGKLFPKMWTWWLLQKRFVMCLEVFLWQQCSRQYNVLADMDEYTIYNCK